MLIAIDAGLICKITLGLIITWIAIEFISSCTQNIQRKMDCFIDDRVCLQHNSFPLETKIFQIKVDY